MAQSTINNGDSGAVARASLNANFTELYAVAFQEPVIVMSDGRMGAITSSTGTAYFQAAVVTIPASTLKGGEKIEISGSVKKYQPLFANLPYRVTLSNPGGAIVTIVQASLSATVCDFPIWQDIQMAADRKSAFCMSINAFNQPGPSLPDTTSTTTLLNTLLRRDEALAGATASIGARAPSSTIMFASYTAPPTVETLLVNFDLPVVISFELSVRNGDVAELFAPFVRISPPGPAPVNFASPKAITIWGDSLTEGTGSSPVSGAPMDYSAQLRRLLPGYPVDPRGLGGQVTQQIVSRLLADAVCGRFRKGIIRAGANDINTDGPTWLAAMTPWLDQVVAFRGGTAGLAICNLQPRAGWATTSAYYVAMQAVNAGLLAKYGSTVVCDIFTAQASASGQVPIGRYLATATTTGTIASGSNQLTVAAATNIAVGQYVVSTGSTAISDGTGGTSPVVLSISGTTITLQNADGSTFSASAALSGAAVTFTAAGEVHFNNSGYTVDANSIYNKVVALGW